MRTEKWLWIWLISAEWSERKSVERWGSGGLLEHLFHEGWLAGFGGAENAAETRAREGRTRTVVAHIWNWMGMIWRDLGEKRQLKESGLWEGRWQCPGYLWRDWPQRVEGKFPSCTSCSWKEVDLERKWNRCLCGNSGAVMSVITNLLIVMSTQAIFPQNSPENPVRFHIALHTGYCQPSPSLVVLSRKRGWCVRILWFWVLAITCLQHLNVDLFFPVAGLQFSKSVHWFFDNDGNISPGSQRLLWPWFSNLSCLYYWHVELSRPRKTPHLCLF